MAPATTVAGAIGFSRKQVQQEGPWVPILLKGGSFPTYREGRRAQTTIQFTEALPAAVQGA
ncbi:hypothetical protein B0919_03825 [Hymenobacter sp. CRA2]|nr:hypothetical protein B0919_03825 [Hymenobacter sp. CRA2]